MGFNPIQIASVEKLGFQVAINSCSRRDLGFTGKIAGKWYAIYGDTLYCAPGITVAADNPPGFHGMVRNSVSLLTDDPLKVIDLNLNDDYPVPHQRQFVPFNSEWGEVNTTAFGGTSLCETNAETAMAAIYYMVNAYEPNLVGAGVGVVKVIDGTPTVVHRCGPKGYWWDALLYAHYGDKIAYRDERSEYIYIWGGPPNRYTGWLEGSYMYLARVKASEAFDLDKYEYYWGLQRGWKSEILTTFTTETAAMWGTGQGQIVWNAYYHCYLLVHLGIASNTVFLRAATSLEGPWTPDVEVYTTTPIDNGLVYAGVAHPYLDPSGKTLVMSFTNNNNIEVIKASFL
ncbi:hypothetical protein QBC47DRAFT_190394 [Echria macrotheca]|uniref:DUF4185 domain-containing protein n=1 Tax=Echria macrotheca TaxID=438768 RepID=A0AAJ0BC09_9PEZI|nr:hypothetical protein QBC47DRAFT_190394 [Echria macrotheca]